MTTKVTIDAHAGWDVLVVELCGEPNYPKTVRQTVVPANEKADFYGFISKVMNLTWYD